MIKQPVSWWQFRDALRGDQYCNWSMEAIEALFDYLEQLSDDIGEDIELDVVAIRCDWSEIHIQELWDEYSHVFENEGLTVENDSDDYDEQLRILQEHTTVLDIRRDTHMGNVVLQEF